MKKHGGAASRSDGRVCRMACHAVYVPEVRDDGHRGSALEGAAKSPISNNVIGTGLDGWGVSLISSGSQHGFPRVPVGDRLAHRRPNHG